MTARRTVEPGEVLLGRYRVDKIVGRGGMGVVVSAFDNELRHQVAIKIFSRVDIDEGESVERFMREARITVNLQSDHVVRVFDAGTLEWGAPYIVMDLLEGHDLGDQPAQPPATAVDYILQAIDAVAEAHAQNVIHRDLKPSNLFLASRAGTSPIIKVLDFGISKVSPGDGELSLTGSMAIMGSPKYMAPEQFVSAKAADERTDVWALGAILYQLLTGEAPFKGSMTELFDAIRHRDPPPIRASQPQVPEELEQLVMRCLRRSPTDRFATVADLAQALAPFGSGQWNRCISRAHWLLSHRTTLVASASDILPGRTTTRPSTPVSIPPPAHRAPPADDPSDAVPSSTSPDSPSKKPLAVGLGPLVVLLAAAMAAGALLMKTLWAPKPPVQVTQMDPPPAMDAAIAPQPVVLAKGGRPWDLAVDGEHVYWSSTFIDEVMQADKSDGGHPLTLASAASGDLQPQALAVDEAYVYFVSVVVKRPNGDGKRYLSRCKIGGCGGAPDRLIEMKGVGRSIALDATHIFWTEGRQVRGMEKKGGPAHSYGIPSPAAPEPMHLATDGDYVYWTSDGGEIWRRPVNLATPFPDLLSKGTGTTGSGIALDAHYVYYAIAQPLGIVQRLNKDSPFDTLIFGTQQYMPWGVAVDANAVYWVTEGVLDANQPATGTLVACPINGKPVEIAQGLSMARAIALDDEFIYWTNEGRTYNDGSVMKIAKP